MGCDDRVASIGYHTLGRARLYPYKGTFSAEALAVFGVSRMPDSLTDGTPSVDSSAGDGLTQVQSPDARDAEERPDAGVIDSFHCPEPFSLTERWQEICDYVSGGYATNGQRDCSRTSTHSFTNPHPAYDLSTGRYFTVCDQTTSTGPTTCGECEGNDLHDPGPRLPGMPGGNGGSPGPDLS
jgi:hypothetical protein